MSDNTNGATCFGFLIFSFSSSFFSTLIKSGSGNGNTRGYGRLVTITFTGSFPKIAWNLPCIDGVAVITLCMEWPYAE